MSRESRKVFAFVLKIVSNRRGFFFWLFIRFISAFLPLITIYLYSHIVEQLEKKVDFSFLILTIILTLIVRLVDNYLRILSVTRLEKAISDISFDVHNFFLSDLEPESQEDRHAAVQAIRNFSDAASVTLNLIKQPGVDSLVNLVFIPVILFVVDFPSFVISLAYIAVYSLIDTYTTQRYSELKDIQNSKTEAYYAKLQDSNDFDLEQTSFTRHFNRLCKWGFVEWFNLQNISVIFYCLNLFYMIYLVASGQADISHLVLVIGYVSQIQTYLNSFSQIKDSLADMSVGLKHLAKNKTISAVSLEDLI